MPDQADIFADSTLSASAVEQLGLAADILANSDLSGAIGLGISVGGTFTGTGVLLETVSLIHVASGLLVGSDGLSGGVRQMMVVGGQVYGTGTLADLLSETVAGTLMGSGTLVGTPHYFLGGRPLPMVGSGTLGDHFPLPMIGHGDLVGLLDVVEVPDRCPPDLSVFRWMQQFEIGDLELHLTDDDGLPYGPVVILYTLYQVLSDSVRVLVGAPDRHPAQQGVGYYYATGIAGEFGQPGEWVIQWRVQRFWYSLPVIFEQHFFVKDAVLFGPPDPTIRSCKKGWL